ncbi:MAG TPA: hydroxyacid dehydrogenase [Gammaproteobacteria bacterium]|nr:hydroxyacid dehydrogenase [Gammaproteobacteria bacterium]
MPALLSRLRDILDDRDIITDRAEAEPYLEERRGRFRGESDVIVRPRDVAEVQAVVRACLSEKTSLVPQGGNTGLCGGAVAESGQVIVSLGRLNKVRHLDRANNTMTVEAGCVLADLQIRARDAHRFFPLSLGAEGSCQIGGNLATNAGGINVLRYGNAREQVLGIEAVMPNGELFSDLHGLRKNNTGYDLKQLLIGSEGTLGVITAATLKLYPHPDQSITALAALRDLQSSISFLEYAQSGSGGTLCSFELMPRIGLDFACRHVVGCSDPMTTPHDWYVLLSLQASGDAIDVEILLSRILETAFEAGEITDAVVASSEQQAQDLWKLREGLVEGQRFEGGSIKHDISVPVSKVPEFIDRASETVTQRVPGIRPCPFGHVGDGNIHFNLSQPVEMDGTAFLALWEEINYLVHDQVAELGGSFSAEHGVGISKIDEMYRYKDPTALAIMATIKRALDPDNLFNPGKVIPAPDTDTDTDSR